MRRRSIFTKLRDAIMGPPLPAHLVKTKLVIGTPLHLRVWRFIRPPRFEGRPLGLNRSQGRLIRIALGAVAALIVAGGIYLYIFSGREERSMAVFQDGMKSVAKVDYKEAVQIFTGAISVWPGNALAYLHRGNSQAALGNTAGAKRDWQRAIELNPDLADAFTARGTQSRIEGNNPQALTELSRSIQLHPSVDAYYQRGQLYATMRDYKKAIDDFDRSIAERRDAPYVYRARAAARRAIGDMAGSAADHDTADRIEGRPKAFSIP